MQVANRYAETKWLRVSKAHHCPICSRPDWCTYSADGAAVICMRVQSSKEVDCGGSGVGWLHKLTDEMKPKRLSPPAPRPKIQPPVTSWDDFLAQAARHTTFEQKLDLGATLGVSVDSLERMGAAWSADNRAWAFPMREPSGKIIGIRLRAMDGKKWCVTGSHNGLFIPDDGMLGDLVTEVIICEGPTDTAAMLDLGFTAIGRPSCSGSVWETAELCYARDAVILGDRDEAKTRPDGSKWYPGQEGAAKLAQCLFGRARTVKIVYPLKGKDARAWKAAGATGAIVRAVINNARVWRPGNGR